MFDFLADGIEVNGSGEVKALCPRCSHTRKKHTQKCLNVNTETGLYHCWHCEWSGKAQEIGRVKPAKTYTRPPEPPIDLTVTARDWLLNRGITNEVLMRNRVTTGMVFMPQVSSEVKAIGFPYYRRGELVNIKWRDREKNFRMESGAERILYGYDDIANTTLICEGEIDKLSLEVAGYRNCVSVPDGAPAPNSKNLADKFGYLNDDGLERVEQWVIAVDTDAPGERLRDELVRRFGPDKCRIVSWPPGFKDANEVLVKLGADVVKRCVDDAQPVPLVGVFSARDFARGFLSMYERGAPSGHSTGWPNVDEFYRVQPGQLTIITGIPGHGKSEFVDALLVNCARLHGWKSAMYSPENLPYELHLMKLAEKYTGKPFRDGPTERMSREDVDLSVEWIDSMFQWINPERPDLDEIIDKARAVVRRSGVRVLVIDPWNEVEHSRPSGMREDEYISLSLMKLRRFARQHDVLVIVVAHPRLIEKKSDGSYPVPTPYDISGGAMWRNKADNCLCVYLDKMTGRVELHVQKVKFRLFGEVGLARLFWDRVTGQYREAT